MIRFTFWINSGEKTIYGMETYESYSFLAILITSILFFKGITAFGMWTEKDWAIKFGIIDAGIGIIVCSFMMFIEPLFESYDENYHLNFRFELLLLIPYLIKCLKIRKPWEEFTEFDYFKMMSRMNEFQTQTVAVEETETEEPVAEKIDIKEDTAIEEKIDKEDPRRFMPKNNIINNDNQNKEVMKNLDYTATIWVEQSPEKAFEAITHFRGWWSEDIEGNTNQLDEVFFYHYKDVHLCKIKLIESVPDKKLVYQVVDNQFSFTEDKTEWTNTKLIFEIAEEDDKTKIQFIHEGLVPDYECYQICNEAWGNYIKNSLYKFITTGKGEPNPKDTDGFNAQIVEKWKLK